MKCHEEWWFVWQGKHPFFHHSAVHIIVLDDHILFQNFYRKHLLKNISNDLRISHNVLKTFVCLCSPSSTLKWASESFKFLRSLNLSKASLSKHGYEIKIGSFNNISTLGVICRSDRIFRPFPDIFCNFRSVQVRHLFLKPF